MKGLLAAGIAIVVLALVLPRGDEPDEPAPPASAPARPRSRAAAASEHTDSRDGMPVFTASDVGPGTLVEGDVTIANTGKAERLLLALPG